MILLTQSSTPIIGWVAKLLGVIMDGIFRILDFLSIPNVGLSIILFTIVVYILMLPLTIRQQKFSKLSAKMNPEIQAIQAKYKGKKDEASVMAQNQETRAVYAKYGVSPTGSCLQLLIQMPILFALYQVIQAMPAYVAKIGNVFKELANKIILQDGGKFLLNPVDAQGNTIESIASTVKMYGKHMEGTNLTNGVVDVLNKLSTSDMAIVAEEYGLGAVQYEGQFIVGNGGLIDTYNNFLGLNVGNSPSHIVGDALQTGSYLLFVGALLIPILAAVTQWINVKMMPTPDNNNNGQQSNMGSSMKMMNNIMPIISAFFCFTLPAGMGLYWIAGSVVRTVQQIIINKRIDKMDFDKLIEQNSAKSAKKIEKMKKRQDILNAYNARNTRNIQVNNRTQADRDADVKKSTDYYNSANAKPGSLMARSNMVRQYNEKNNKETK